jgi:hypothetical protein
VSVLVTRRVLTAIWQRLGGEPPPEGAADRRVTWRAALTWAAATGVALPRLSGVAVSGVRGPISLSKDPVWSPHLRCDRRNGVSRGCLTRRALGSTLVGVNGEGDAVTEAVKITRDSLRTPRAAAIAGIVFAVLLGAALVLLRISVPADRRDAPTWLDDPWRKNSVIVALNLVPFAGLAFLWFSGVIRDRIGAAEDRFFATAFLGTEPSCPGPC